MCYAIPGKIDKIEGKIVTVEYFGEKRKAHNELESLSLGDYVYAQGGFVISKISQEEAESVLSVWKEEFFNLQEVDLKLSGLAMRNKGVDRKLTQILDKAVESKILNNDEFLYLLGLKDKDQEELLFKTANFLRQKYHKNSCCVHGIIEISNCCQSACTYCGISVHNNSLKRYRMNRGEILSAAKEAIEDYGFKSLVLQSGESNDYNITELAEIIKEIKEKWPCLIFISFGEIGLDNLEVLYKAGARGLLMRFETSNPEIYKKINPGKSLDNRLNHLKKAYQLGYLILTGSLIGLPEQTQSDILNDIYLAKELHAEMYSFGPFIPHPNTPLAKYNSPSQEDILKVLALTRIIDSEHAKILVTTALETLNPQTRKMGLLSGANSVMLNVTPLKYRPLYSIYPQRAHALESIQTQIEEIVLLLRSLGRAPTDLSI